MEIIQLNTIIYCKHWDDTLTFYRDTLKLTAGFSTPWFVEFHMGDHGRLSIADQRKTRQESAEGRGITLSFEVASIDSTHSELCDLNLSPSPISPHPWDARVCYIRDPEGNRIEFWERLDSARGRV